MSDEKKKPIPRPELISKIGLNVFPAFAMLAGIELENDAKEEGTWIDKSGTPRVGDLAIFKRSGAAWARHVTRVVRFDREAGVFWTIGGNESDTWREQARKIDDPTLLGFIRIGA